MVIDTSWLSWAELSWSDLSRVWALMVINPPLVISVKSKTTEAEGRQVARLRSSEVSNDALFLSMNSLH